MEERGDDDIFGLPLQPSPLVALPQYSLAFVAETRAGSRNWMASSLSFRSLTHLGTDFLIGRVKWILQMVSVLVLRLQLQESYMLHPPAIVCTLLACSRLLAVPVCCTLISTGSQFACPVPHIVL